MWRNCNLELQLVPPSSHGLLSSDNYSSPSDQFPKLDWINGRPKQEEQQLTIFYNGKMAICDVTELQAKAIILLASRQNEEGSRTPTCSSPSSSSYPLLQSRQIYGLSMKKSLQRFLHKRKNRMQAISPYHHRNLSPSHG